MELSISMIQAELMRNYYKYFSKYAKGRTPDRKVAWVTSFTPVEILEALDIYYCYPESYAAVIAASEKEQEMLTESDRQYLCRDCCSYSCCIEGCLSMQEGPRGVPPKPDILIATNNQCNTLPVWWNILADRYNVPLIVIDYPGEGVPRDEAFAYVTEQHLDLIARLEALSGNKLDKTRLLEILGNSSRSVAAWNNVAQYLKTKADVSPTMFFDDINYLITARCNPMTAQLYGMMADELSRKPDSNSDKIPVFWLGYPLWYHMDRYLSEEMQDFRIVGSNYITWWSLDYSGGGCFEMLFNAYNYTFLNLSQCTRNERLVKTIRESGAECTVTLHNKSCKCDFVSAKDIDIPQAEIDMDMIDRTFLNTEKARAQIRLLKDTVCTG